MQTKEKRIYESVSEIRDAKADGSFKVGDMYLTKDSEGEALFEIADIRKKKIFLCRKYLLKDRPMNGLMEYLNGEYYNSLEGELKEAIVERKGQKIFLPREVEVFGDYIYSEDTEKGKQWELFKNVKKRIKCHSKDDERSDWWWLSSPSVGNAADFCVVDASGAAGDYAASGSVGVAPCFLIGV